MPQGFVPGNRDITAYGRSHGNVRKAVVNDHIYSSFFDGRGGKGRKGVWQSRHGGAGNVSMCKPCQICIEIRITDRYDIASPDLGIAVGN